MQTKMAVIHCGRDDKQRTQPKVKQPITRLTSTPTAGPSAKFLEMGIRLTCMVVSYQVQS